MPQRRHARHRQVMQRGRRRGVPAASGERGCLCRYLRGLRVAHGLRPDGFAPAVVVAAPAPLVTRLTSPIESAGRTDPFHSDAEGPMIAPLEPIAVSVE